MPDVVVELASRRFAIPYECPCCGSAPDGEVAIELAKSARSATASAHAIDFPYCRPCIEHAARHDASATTATAVAVVALAASVMVGAITRWWIGLAVFVAAVPIAAWLARLGRAKAAATRKSSCASSALAVQYLGWRDGTSAFSFASPTYTARFAEANVDKLANQSAPLRKLLDAYRLARQQVPTPAAAVTTLPPPLTVKEWIARIEGAPGPAARRYTFDKAVQSLHDPLDKRELVQATARADLARVLDRLAAYANPAGKLRWLAQAIAEIGRDNIPDELAAAELELLEARRSELTG